MRRRPWERVEGAEVQQSSAFDQAVDAIVAADGSAPMWSAPPRPGNPFRVHSFTAIHEYKGAKVQGFVMLLYYRTAEEVASAQAEINRYIGPDMPNYGVQR